MDNDNGLGGDESGERMPWEEDAPDDPPGERRDAFNGVRKRKFLKALARAGCWRDACRAAGVSHQTAYNHQDSDPEFARYCDLASKMAATDVELSAWERGVVGVEEDVRYRGDVVGTRLKHSDSILRLLLQGANRKKYGPRPGFSRKRLLKHERKQIEREIRAELAAHEPDPEQLRQGILTKLDALNRQLGKERRATGWIETEDGEWIPPGWVRADGAAASAAPPQMGGSKVTDSV